MMTTKTAQPEANEVYVSFLDGTSREPTCRDMPLVLPAPHEQIVHVAP